MTSTTMVIKAIPATLIPYSTPSVFDISCISYKDPCKNV